MVAKAGEIEIKGVVKQALPNAMFKVALDDGRLVTATISGKMRIYRIRILEGDRVVVLMTPYDETRGRITYRQQPERGPLPVAVEPPAEVTL